MRFGNSKSEVNRVIREHRAFPFEYGSHDCGILVADAIQVQIGADVAAAYRGRYESREELDALLAADGYSSHVEILAALFEEIHYSQAVTGDVAAVHGDDGTLVTGVVSGPYIFLFGYKGIGALPLDRAVRVFRIENT